ncbi:hypothetical protein BSL78_26548 [Apostichopus japonicus]|uniref:Uncharacterized protein n=1 Tax=Stichopus japonicus TaxID=307972 RepID=A0A2G8JLN2_STIJA|nr:hypothetical protein BSL78_26548 [Apostichopus japonicus]
MEMDTPLTKTDGSPKKVGRQRIPPVAYDENDVVMRDIQERMREKRQKRADLSRSRRANITNASLQLKISLRANNRALAKALEEARCESRQDKDTIFELQCALETSQHELRQSYRTIQELKLEGISLMDLITHFQESESKQRKRIYEVKKLLNDVTGKYLMNTVTLIDKAAGICNTPSLSKGSSFFVPKGSLSEDNFRDTLSVPMEDSEAMSRIPTDQYATKSCIH